MAASSTENPVTADAPPEEDDRDNQDNLEAACARLRLREDMKPKTVEDLETVMRAREALLKAELQAKFDAKIEQLQAQLAENGAPFSSAVRSVVARLSEARPNWHQATIMLFAADDELWRFGAFLVSVLMVLGQSMVAAGVVAGTGNPSCASSDQCERKGMFCGVGVGGSDRCLYCGNSVPLSPQTDPATGGTLNDARATDHVGFNTTQVAEICAGANPSNPIFNTRAGVDSWCQTCVHAIDGRVDELTATILAQANVSAMGPFDWVALVLASVVVALQIGGELKVR
jgi:hypothetical protein